MVDSPAQLAWERQYRRVQLEFDPDAALPRLAELARTPLGDAVKADLEQTALEKDEAAGRSQMGIPLRKAPLSRDNLQRLARMAPHSGIRRVDTYPLTWWHRSVAAILLLCFFAAAGWSGWAYFKNRNLSHTLTVTGATEMRVKAAVAMQASGNWQTVTEMTGMPFQVPVEVGKDHRLVLYGDDEKVAMKTLDLDPVEDHLTVQLAVEADEEEQSLGYLVATNDRRDVLHNHKITVRNALFSQTVDAANTLNLAPGQWQVKVETNEKSPEGNQPVSIGGSKWQSVTLKAGKKAYLKFNTDAYFRDRLKNGGYGPQMVSMPAGTFTMGSPDSEVRRGADEGPQHTVSLKAFAIGRYEVTFAEYDAFCEATGGEKPDDEGWGRGSRPVINVSWDDARTYAQWLSEQTNTTYRLSTEAEWEYAARAGSRTAYYWGNDIRDACGYANVYDETSKQLIQYDWEHASCRDHFVQTAMVGMFAANAYGLYDMTGNVWEWVSDWYAEDYYVNSPIDNPTGPEKGVSRVVRGGSWSFDPSNLRSANRYRFDPANRYVSLGFRLARTP